MTLVLEAFAGPGGWSEGLRLAGFDGTAVGVELDPAACRTAMTAGHLRVRADVATYPLGHLDGRVDGLIQSPPCQAWSTAGDQLGKVDQPLVYERIAYFARGQQPPDREWADPRSQLTAEPMRWAHALRPRWIALEQVPPVLPLWQYTAEKLRELGYRTWTGILSAEQYGVPQTRRRAILIARRDGLPVGPPEPTHQQYRAGRALLEEPDLFGGPLPPPVSMAEALGWGVDGRPAWTVTGGGTESGGGVEVFANAGVRARLREAAICTNNNSRVGGGRTELYTRGIAAPAPTLTGNVNRWTMAPAGATSTMVEPRPIDDPGHTITGKATAAWVAGEQTVRVAVEEAAVLQSFPADYPWQGNKSEQYRQVGDAMPPLLARAVLALLTEGRRAA